MDWDKLRIFHAVAKAGGLTQASDVLHLSQSAVSRQIRNLEEAIGAPLFHRHARGLILTGEGELLFDSVSKMQAELTQASARIRDERESVKGELKVTTTIAFGTLWLAPRLQKWRALHPNVTLELLLNEHFLNIAMREADIAIRMRSTDQADLIQKPLLESTTRLYCNQSFIEHCDVEITAENLNQLPIIMHGSEAAQSLPEFEWSRLFNKNRPVLTVNSHYGMLQAARNGVGIAPLPDYMVVGVKDLVCIVPELHSDPSTIYTAYPVELRKSRRVAAFREFLSTEIKQLQA